MSVRDGYVAEFASHEDATRAVKRLRELGYAKLDAFGPFPAPHLEEALGVRRTRLPWFVLGATLGGAALAVAVQAWTNAVDYPIDVGGRPLASWVTHVPIAFETAVLFGAGAAFVLFFLFSGLPRLHHAVFEMEGFERTRVDRFWITIGYPDPVWTADLEAELRDLGADDVRVVGEVPS